PSGCTTRTSSATATSSRCWSDGCAASSTRGTSCILSRRCAAGAIASRCRATRGPEPPGANVHSLSRRLLLSVSAPLALFFGVMMVVLDTGFRALSERTLRELLDSQMVSLIAAAEPQTPRPHPPPPPPPAPTPPTPHPAHSA